MDVHVLDDLLGGIGPRTSPYDLIAADYIEAWVDDIAAGLQGSNSRLYRLYRHEALSQAVAGVYGDYEDEILSLVAASLQVEPGQLWVQLFNTAYKKARADYECSSRTN